MFWDAPGDWREAQNSIDHHLNVYAGRSGALLDAAGAIAGKIDFLEPVLDNLCERTCPDCGEPCCVRATVRYDFRDLVFLHLFQTGLPVGQPSPVAGQACSCLGDRGCMIPRVMRPFMCTWYVCPGQMALVRAGQSGQKYCLTKRLREIQDCRKGLEAGFLQLVGPYCLFFQGMELQDTGGVEIHMKNDRLLAGVK